MFIFAFVENFTTIQKRTRPSEPKKRNLEKRRKKMDEKHRFPSKRQEKEAMCFDIVNKQKYESRLHAVDWNVTTQYYSSAHTHLVFISENGEDGKN